MIHSIFYKPSTQVQSCSWFLFSVGGSFFPFYLLLIDMRYIPGAMPLCSWYCFWQAVGENNDNAMKSTTVDSPSATNLLNIECKISTTTNVACRCKTYLFKLTLLFFYCYGLSFFLHLVQLLRITAVQLQCS